MYDRLFSDAQQDAGGKDFIKSLNPNSLKVITAIVEPSLTNAQPDQKFQFERQGYFVADRVDHVVGQKPGFNLAVGLKDSWVSSELGQAKDVNVNGTIQPMAKNHGKSGR